MRVDFQKDLNEGLNGPQRQAVTTVEGPVLIIAGAGSGKTRVITYRIAYMLRQGIAQQSILALTFTNKAAREMESRVKEATALPLRNLTVSTFHAFGVQILRAEIEALGYRRNFSIYDETDRQSAIREALRECKVSPEGVDVGRLGQVFSAVKTGLADWGAGANDAFRPVYEDYQQSLKVYNAVDFDDLLVLPIKLFTSVPSVLKKYHERYRYILVDEFQDTSAIQYRLLRMIAWGGGGAESDNTAGVQGESRLSVPNVCVVGDDDQSIYSWRGANYENIVNFEKDFPRAVEIKLEQNYRSTTTILEAANGVIAHNENRKEKRLWSGNGSGKAIDFYAPANESEEAEFIAARIRELRVGENRRFDDFGVLLRTNSLLQTIEEAFLAHNLPYRVSGGQSFFDRKEIRDVLSYLRVIANPDDDVNLLRIINTPRRGIGKNSVGKLVETAKQKHCSIWEAMGKMRFVEDALFQQTDRAEFDIFMTLIEKHREEMLGKRGLCQKVSSLVDEIDYWSYLVTEYSKNDKLARWKFANIRSLIESIGTWEKNPDNLDPTLYPYLNRISLLTRSDDDEANKGKINLMTIHASKGLEFPVVFIAGVENGVIPHARSLEENAGSIEEERRLFYVAITRARDKLVITACRKRKRAQSVEERSPSPFLDEIPPNLIEYHASLDDGSGGEGEGNEVGMEAFAAMLREKSERKNALTL